MLAGAAGTESELRPSAMIAQPLVQWFAPAEVWLIVSMLGISYAMGQPAEFDSARSLIDHRTEQAIATFALALFSLTVWTGFLWIVSQSETQAVVGGAWLSGSLVAATSLSYYGKYRWPDSPLLTLTLALLAMAAVSIRCKLAYWKTLIACILPALVALMVIFTFFTSQANYE
jgi:hypothetical protein